MAEATSTGQAGAGGWLRRILYGVLLLLLLCGVVAWITTTGRISSPIFQRSSSIKIETGEYRGLVALGEYRGLVSSVALAQHQQSSVHTVRVKMLTRGPYSRPLSGPQYNSRAVYSIVSKNLILRSVHYDPRPRGDGHANATVFVVEGSSRVLLNGGLIVQCQLGSHVTSSLSVRVLNEGSLTHIQALVDCYDLPIEGYGIRAFLYYRETASDKTIYTAESEWPFEPSLVCNPPSSCNVSSMRIVACVSTLHYGNPPVSQYRLFYHWLAHLKSIGVDHVHITTEHSFLSREGFANSYIYQVAREHSLSVNFWQHFLNETNVKNHSKILAYNDCVYRYLGIYDYALIVDWNYFLSTTNISSNNSLLELCGGEGGCRFGSRTGTVKCGKNLQGVEKFAGGEDMSGTATSGVPVFLHRTTDMVSVGVARESEVQEGYTVQNVPPSTAVFTQLKCG